MRFRLLSLALAAVGITACAPAAPAAPSPPPPAAPDAQQQAAGSGPAPSEAARAAPPAPAAVKVGLAYAASDAGLLIAMDRGHYQEQNLQVEFEKIESAANLLPALEIGRAHV